MKDNREIFNNVHPNKNYILSKFSKNDLLDLLYLISIYQIEYRNSLGLSDIYTFGVEIEVEDSNKLRDPFQRDCTKKIEKVINNKDWKVVHDGSLDNGAEINSPILYDSKENWEELYDVCNNLKNYAKTSDRTGGHVHVGKHILGMNDDYLANLAMLWSAYENIIFRFTDGEYLTYRNKRNTYSMPIRKIFKEDYEEYKNDSMDFERLSDCMYGVKYLALRTNYYSSGHIEQGNTIEFRSPNGSIDPIVWQNNINLFTKMIKYSKNQNFDKKILEKRLLDEACDSTYEDIYIDQTLEFCDLVFNKNIDKINFLKQYLKGFETSNNFKKAKQFTIDKK